MVASSDPRLGSLLVGRWRLTRVLGAGGMATIYEARERDQAPVAVKLVHPVLSADETIRLRLLREAHIAQEVGHPGVVRVLETGTDEAGVPFLVMELLEGKSLEVLRQESGGRLPVPFVNSIGERVLEVLVAAHRRSVLHRDLKPGNLFATSDGRIKVLDFGIADSRRLDPRLSANTEHGQLMGTPGYMPPEQALGRWSEVDQRSDLWALGATLFTLVTGRPVHEGRDKSEQLGLAMSTPARSVRSLISDLPAPLEIAIDGALAFDRDARWQSAEEMLAALHGRAARRPYRAEQLSNRDRTVGGAETDTGLERAVAEGRSLARRPAHRALVAAALALAMGLIALGLWFHLRPLAAADRASGSVPITTAISSPAVVAVAPAALAAPSLAPSATSTTAAPRRPLAHTPLRSAAAPLAPAPLVSSSEPPPPPPATINTAPWLLDNRR
jgi:eukaryotic-like serine/threonine-protein kinase